MEKLGLHYYRVALRNNHFDMLVYLVCAEVLLFFAFRKRFVCPCDSLLQGLGGYVCKSINKY